MEPLNHKEHPIRTARLRRKLTQEKLGQRLGVTKATISSWETGRYDPEPAVACRLSRALGIRLEQVYQQHMEA